MTKEYKILDRTFIVGYDEYEVARVTKDAMECILVDLSEKIRADERRKTIDDVMIAFKCYQNMHNPKDASVFWEQLLQMKGGAEK